MPKISDTKKALGTIVRAEAEKAAGSNKLVSRKEQKALNPFLREAAEALRRERPGARIDVDDIVARALDDASKAWGQFNKPGRGQNTFSREELKKLAERMPELGQLTRAAMKAVTPAPAALPNVSLENPPPGITLTRLKDVVTLKADASVPVGTKATLVVDAQRFSVTRNPGGFNLSALTANLAEGYGAGMPQVRQTPNGIETSIRIIKDPPGSLDTAGALVKAREGLAEYLQRERIHDADWAQYFPTDWGQAVAAGILDKVAAFASEPDSVIREEERYIFTGRGPYDLYTEVEVRKSDGKVLRAYVEID